MAQEILAAIGVAAPPLVIAKARAPPHQERSDLPDYGGVHPQYPDGPFPGSARQPIRIRNSSVPMRTLSPSFTGQGVSLATCLRLMKIPCGDWRSRMRMTPLA